ncbi:MAG: hypothetical protein Q8P81_02660, partial [Nanoarchaeota archaeon]|nr:hypothetical protein [Nanoarchaeota archaeon]
IVSMSAFAESHATIVVTDNQADVDDNDTETETENDLEEESSDETSGNNSIVTRVVVSAIAFVEDGISSARSAASVVVNVFANNGTSEVNTNATAEVVAE